MRLILAIQCFFAILFGKTVPDKALPPPKEDPAEREQERARLAKELEESKQRAGELEKANAELTSAKADLEKQLDESKSAAGAAGEAKAAQEKAEAEAGEQKARADKLKEEKEAAEGKLKEARDHGALALLSWLQREGRLIDFLKEDIDSYEDDQVGAAVRAIHKGCLKVIDEGIPLESIMEGEEETRVEIAKGFDPVAIQLTGNVKGDPPFKGTLMHRGWRAQRVSVPVPETVDPHVLAPAEVEL